MSSQSRSPVFGAAIALALAVFSTAPAVQAQQGGTLTGRVTDAQSGEPVGSVQIFISDLDVGVLSQSNGRYLLQNVPAGTHTVTAERIGYRTATEEVTVEPGQTLVENFILSEEALQLDEVVVTGTPGGTQRRAIGNAVATLDASEVTAQASIGSFQELLTAQAPGLDFGRLSGSPGQGSDISIRGISSMSLGQQPLIYVDGVRVNNDHQAGPKITHGRRTSQVSVLEDFSPDEIESIEIIKGPAAATLYGTEASAGVIQIITKKGEQGSPQIHASVTQGANYLSDPSGKIGTQWGIDGDGNLIEGFDGYPNIYEWEKGANGYDPLGYGRTQGYNLDVRGGTEQLTYFLSGGWRDDVGIVDYAFDESLNLRGNFGVVFSEALTLDISAGFVSGLTSFAQQLSEPGGIWDAILWAQPELINASTRGYLRYTPEDMENVEATREYERFTGSATVTHRYGDWLTQRLVVGLDRGNDENQVLVPRHPDGVSSPFGRLGLGHVRLGRPKTKDMTLDYSASLDYRLNDAVGFTSSVGAQYYSSERNEVLTEGDVLASPALRSIEGATSVDVSQIFLQNKSLGLYFQQEVDLNGRIFLTGAVRADDNSAFGSEFSAAVYPKASATWVISEEEFWDDVPYLNSLRLRTALGQAGRQPGTLDAVTLYEATTGRGGEPAMLPGNLGSPEVGPEVGTEVEVGFDYGLFDDRLSGEFTYFHQWTRDALATLPLMPSLGFAGSEVQNLGQINNWGWEATMNVRALEREDWGLDVLLSADHQMNELIDLGGRPPTFSMQEGFPFPAYTTDIITSAEFDAGGNPVNVMCDAGTGTPPRPGGESVPCSETEGYELLLGPGFAPWTYSVAPTLSLLGRDLQIFALAEGEYGEWYSSVYTWCRFAGCFTNARMSLALDDPIYVEGAVFEDRHPEDDTIVQVTDRSFWRLRRIGARYSLPDELMQGFGVDRASISATATNPWLIWQRTPVLPGGVPQVDPEHQGPGAGSQQTSDFGLMPPTSSFSFRFDVTL